MCRRWLLVRLISSGWPLTTGHWPANRFDGFLCELDAPARGSSICLDVATSAAQGLIGVSLWRLCCDLIISLAKRRSGCKREPFPLLLPPTPPINWLIKSDLPPIAKCA